MAVNSNNDDLFSELFTNPPPEEKKEEQKKEPQKEQKPKEQPKQPEPQPASTDQDLFNFSAPTEGKVGDASATVAQPTSDAKEVMQTPSPSPPAPEVKTPAPAPQSKDPFDFNFNEPEQGATSPPIANTTITQAEVSPAPPIQVTQEEGFDYSDAPKSKLIIITVYGLKGPGKTFSSFSLPGTILCISFDRKSEPVHEQEFNGDSRIIVKDGLRYLDKTTPLNYTKSAEKTFNYIVGKEEPQIGILEKFKRENKKFDWVMLDCTEEMNRICEMVMRYRNNLLPSQGIANRNLWKDRRLYINQIHNAAVDIANKGIIYTTYTDEEKIIKDGEIVALTTIPKWFDVQMLETDVVIHVTVEQNKTGDKKFIGVVDSSKYKIFPTHNRADITNKGLPALMRDASEVNKQ